jgi:hypothetical protein
MNGPYFPDAVPEYGIDNIGIVVVDVGKAGDVGVALDPVPPEFVYPKLIVAVPAVACATVQ